MQIVRKWPWVLLLVASTVKCQDIRHIPMSDNDLVTIHCQKRYSTMVIFPTDERFVEGDAGDAAGSKPIWSIEGPGKSVIKNFCTIRPNVEGKHTNANMFTKDSKGIQHSYSFALWEVSKEEGLRRDYKIFVTHKGKEITVKGHGDSSEEPMVPKAEVEKCNVDVIRAHNQLVRMKDEVVDVKREAEGKVNPERYFGQLKYYKVSRKLRRGPFWVDSIAHDDIRTLVRLQDRKGKPSEVPSIFSVQDGKNSVGSFDVRNGVIVVPKVIEKGTLKIGKKSASFEMKDNG